jgi:hypothetical protein
MAKNKTDKRPWILLILVVAIAILAQVFTYARYEKLNNSVNGFIDSIQYSQDEAEIEESFIDFVEEVAPVISAQKSEANFLGDIGRGIKKGFGKIFGGKKPSGSFNVDDDAAGDGSYDIMDNYGNRIPVR